MFGFITRVLTILVSMVLDAIRWDCGNAALKGEVPVTIFALTGAILGALVAGFFGAVVCAVVGAYCAKFYKESARASL
jgi:uncharacterized membrane protein YjjB (DUF3815 family)